MHVIGTAGHVDHGKSVLVEALTGINPDRLQEEQERGMTIDLGFAWMILPSGEEVSIVDVPGHEDFIKNMLAGVGGIDLALLVVAADEGVMPQTREHLAILDLLNVRTGVVAITKTDLIDGATWDDPAGWLELVQLELEELLEGTSLAGAPIVPVSALTGEGMPELVSALDAALSHLPPVPASGHPRLPVDRVFSLTGFGTVVTGTLLAGPLSLGDEVEIIPPRVRARIRGLQTHRRPMERVEPGSRVAINLAGVDTDQIQRGDVITVPGWSRPTRLVDVALRLLGDAPQPLAHNAPVTLFVGAAQMPSRVRVLGGQAVEPGTTAYAQLRLTGPLSVASGDRFIIRRPSPAITIGGGRILDPHPRRRYRRFEPGAIERLRVLAEGAPNEVMLQQVKSLEPIVVEELVEACSFLDSATMEALEALLADGRVLVMGHDAQPTQNLRASRRVVMSSEGWARARDEMTSLLRGYHEAHPLRRGMPRGALRSQLRRRVRRLSDRSFDELVVQALREGLIADEGALVRLAGHEVTFGPVQQAAIDSLLAQFEAAPYGPPPLPECESQVGEEVLNALMDQGRLIRVSEDVLFTPAAYEDMLGQVRAFIKQEGGITVAQARDIFGSSRRYLLALLEYLDAQGITRRVGDERVLR